MSDIRRNLETFDDDWEDYGLFYLNKFPQGSPKWKEARKLRITASNVGTVCSHNKFKSCEKYEKEFTGETEVIYSELNKYFMNIGTQYEPIARKWYCSTFKKIVLEYGFAVRKDDVRIGASIDGLVLENMNSLESESDTIIEIKCPKFMYKPISDYMKNSSNLKNSEYLFEHINKTHYDQMQCSMWTLGKKFCDYVVYSVKDGGRFVQRIPFDNNYWENMLYPCIKEFLDRNIYII